MCACACLCVCMCVCMCVCVCVCTRANAGTFTQRQLVDSEIKQRHKDKVCYRLHPIVDCSTMCGCSMLEAHGVHPIVDCSTMCVGVVC